MGDAELADIEVVISKFWDEHSVNPEVIYFNCRRIERIRKEEKVTKEICSQKGLKSLFPTLGAKRNG